MIRFFEENDKKTIVSIWREAFGDSERRILDFVNNFGKYMLVLETEKRVVSMLTLLPVKIKGKTGRYVYAVATDKSYRNMGFAGDMIEYVKRYVKEIGEEFLVLVPQSASLFDFYKKFGFSELKCAKRFDFKQDTELKKYFSITKLTAKEYFEHRKCYFENSNYVEWDIGMLEYFEKLYEGAYYEIKNGSNTAYAFCYTEGSILVIPEILSKEDTKTVLDGIGAFFGKERVLGVCECRNSERAAMVYPEGFDDAYFGIAMN